MNTNPYKNVWDRNTGEALRAEIREGGLAPTMWEPPAMWQAEASERARIIDALRRARREAE